MPNRKLSVTEITKANDILEMIRGALARKSHGDPELLFALRRRLIVKLTHDERGTPAHRNKLKQIKREQQAGVCPICSDELPLKYAELDRFVASEAIPSRTRGLSITNVTSRISRGRNIFSEPRSPDGACAVAQ